MRTIAFLSLIGIAMYLKKAETLHCTKTTLRSALTHLNVLPITLESVLESFDAQHLHPQYKPGQTETSTTGDVQIIEPNYTATVEKFRATLKDYLHESEVEIVLLAIAIRDNFSRIAGIFKQL